MRSTKIAALFLAAAVSAATFTAVSAQAAPEVDYTQVIVFGMKEKVVTLDNIEKSLKRIEGSPVLNKSRKIKNCFSLGMFNSLTIPKGKTLTLSGGANLEGCIYIEKGGKLVIDRYSVENYGTIICDGTLEVTGGTLRLNNGSILYIGSTGKFNGKTGYDEKMQSFNTRIYIEPEARVICLGSTDYPSSRFSSKPLAAVHRHVTDDEAVGLKYTSKVITEGLDELIKTGYTTTNFFGKEEFDEYTVFFDGGSSITYTGTPEAGWCGVGGEHMNSFVDHLQKYRDPSYKEDGKGNPE